MGFFDFLSSKPQTPDYTQAINTLNAAGQDAATRGVFKPVTISTSYGTPTYQYDAQGRLISAGYTPSEFIQGQQAQGQNLSNQYLNLAQDYLGRTQALTSADQTFGAGNKLYGLAEQALPTSYDVSGKTQEYYNRMQQMVAPQREQQLASTRQNLFNRGRQGLSVGATQAGGMLATNPEMAAYYNSVAQQDLGLANQAEQQARANLQQDIATGTGLYKTGAGMFGTGADLQNAYLRNVTAAQVPYAASLSNLGTLETMAQQPLQLGLQFGAPTTQGMQYGASALQNAAYQVARMQGMSADQAAQAANTPTFLQSLAMGTMGSLAKAGTNWLTGSGGGGDGLFKSAGNWLSSSSNPFSDAGQAMSNSGFSWSPSGWNVPQGQGW